MRDTDLFDSRNLREHAPFPMHIVAVGWAYVVLMMVLAEALGPSGSVLGAFVTLLLYGVLPLGLVLYIGGARGRARVRRSAQAAQSAGTSQPIQPAQAAAGAGSDGVDPGRGGEPAGEAVAPVREEA
jgi:hypothetical protein